LTFRRLHIRKEVRLTKINLKEKVLPALKKNDSASDRWRWEWRWRRQRYFKRYY